jgi:hypothetical protein
VRTNGRTVWLWWWLGVFVAGCSPAAFSSTSTHIPTPLLNFTLPIATPTPILRLLRTPTLRATGVLAVTRTIPTPLPITLNSPACYETPTGSLWCFGLAHNGLSVTVGQITIHLYLVKADGTAVAEQEITLSRPLLLPGEAAPYGVLFGSVPEGIAGPVAVLISAGPLTDTSMTALKVQGVSYELRDSVYRVSGTLVNQTATPVQQLAVTTTLFDNQGRVTGFRESRFPPTQKLAPGESLAFLIETIPQGLGTTRAEATATGRFS